MKTTVTHFRLGEVTLVRSARSRRIALGVKPSGEIRLSYPAHTSAAKALDFLDQKAEWVEKTRVRLAEKYPQQVLGMPFSTRSHYLLLRPSATEKIATRIAGEQIVVTYPAEMHYADDLVQQAIRRGAVEAMRIEAREILPARVAQLAADHGFTYRSVTPRNTRSKWGSCSPRNDLSLSIHLVRLPDHLIDYIILHELCHTVHKNHGPRFHELLDRHCGGRHAELRRELRGWHTRW